MPRARKYRGSCLCSAVKVSFSGNLDDAYFCHCQQCRKNYGMHGASVGVARDELTIDDPKRLLTSYRSSRTTIRQFCGRCGSPISWDRKGYENIYVSLGLLDGKIAVPKVKNIHTKDKGAYYNIS